MNLISQKITHTDVVKEIEEVSFTNYKFHEIKCPFKGMYSLSNFQDEEIYILFRKIGFAYRNDPCEYRAQAPDALLSNFLDSNDIKISNFNIVGFFKIIETKEITLSFFNKIGSKAKNRSYYVNINSIIEANQKNKSDWYNAEGFRVSTVRTGSFFKELKARY